MEKKDTGFKVIAICGLLIAVVGLTIGFAALSATLTIQSGATVKIGDASNFSKYIGFKSVASTSPTCSVTTAGTDTVTCTAGSFSTDTGDTKHFTTWSGLSANLYTNGDGATFTATIENASDYDGKVSGITTTGGLTCAPATGSTATQTEADAVCAATTVKVEVGGVTATIGTTGTSSTGTAATIAKTSGTQTATVTMSYTGSLMSNGDITVTIPSISVVYTTATN